jgi:hypothetical protein
VKTSKPFAILLTEATETTKNDGHQVIPVKVFLCTKTRYLTRLKFKKQPVLNYLMPYYFTKINNYKGRKKTTYTK